MRFMMIMIPNISEENWDAETPRGEFAAMGKYNDELTKAGVLLAVDGLQPTAKGARVSFAGGKPSVTDGPFTEAKELIGGYWLIQARSKEEAVEWATRCPANDGDVIEVRQVYEMSDFDEAGLTDDAAPPPADTRPRHRRGLADRVGAGDRRPGPDRARHRLGRGPRPGRAGGGARAVAAVGHPGQPGGLADGHRQAPGDRPAAPPPDGRAPPRRAGAPAGARARHRRARPGRRRRRRHRRRHAEPAVRDLPPDALGAGAGGADAAAVRRPDHAGDRPRLPRLGGDGRPARGAGQAHAGRGARPAGGADRRRAGTRGWPRCSRSSISSSTRATPPPPARTGCGRRCARTPCGWDASWPSCCPARPRSTASWRSWRSRPRARGRGWGRDGEPVLLLDQDRSRWDRVLIGRGLRRWPGPSSWAARSAPTRSRPPSPPATRGPRRRTRPTGGGSSPSMTRWPS